MYIPIPIVLGAVALILVLLLTCHGGRRREDLLEPPAAVQIPEALASEVRTLLAQHHKLSAIKLVRERSGLGLKEAKMLSRGWCRIRDGRGWPILQKRREAALRGRGPELLAIQ